MIEAVKLEADIYPAGPRGLSAYEIHKKEGGQLSEEEWLKSLNGLTPTIGENGNWFLGTVDTGLPSRGPKGDTGSIKFIVVTELPTENIDETAIYLKPVESPKGENNFEELIYVNGKWEDLGTPNVAVDLSNYYTKEESDTKLNKKQDKLPIYYASVYTPIKDLLPIFNSWLSDYKRTNMMPMFSMGYSDTPYTGNSMYLKSVEYNNTTKLWYFNFSSTIGELSAPITQEIYMLSYDSENEVFLRCQKAGHNGQYLTPMYDFSKGASFGKRALSTTNTEEYTPTADYHPATKKYVDDNAKTYTAGDNITISEENVISASGGDNNDVSIYTWIYNNFPGSANTNIKDAFGTFFQDIINDAYTKGKKGIIVIKTSTSGSGLNTDKQYALTATNCNLQLQPTVIAFFGAPVSMDTNIYQRMNFQWARVRAIGTWDNGIFTLDTLYWDGIKNISFLPTNNMWSYTPTGDYNPATKKYVDDQVGNINTVLATLTTVSEVTK